MSRKLRADTPNDGSPLIPSNPAFRVAYLRDRDDRISIRYGSYSDLPAEDVEGFVVLINGRTEFIEKYEYLLRDLKIPEKWGWVTWDHRGQGGSGGARSFVETFDDFVSDGTIVIDHIVGQRPYILLCHSMGSLVGLYGIVTGRFTPLTAVFLSPLFGFRSRPIPPLLARPLSSLVSKVGLGVLGTHTGRHSRDPFVSNKLTHSQSRLVRMRSFNYRPTDVTFGWVHASIQAMDAIHKEEAISKLPIDILIAGSDNDPVVSTTAWEKWFEKAKNLSPHLVKLKTFKSAKHELLSEIPKYYVPTLRLIEQWIGKRSN